MFRFLFKYPATVFSKGKLVLLGPWPAWSLAAFTLAAAGLLAWIIWLRRDRLLKTLTTSRIAALWSMQFATVAILLLLLWQPAISVTALRPQQNIVAVVLDDSASMRVSDQGAARGQQAIQLLQAKLLPELTKKYQVRLYRLNGSLARAADLKDFQASGPATQIGHALNELSKETATLPIGAVVLLSDGADNSGGIDLGTLNELRSRRLSVNTIGFGRERLNQDVELDDFSVTQKVLANSRVEALVRFRQDGFKGRRARLQILADGRPAASRDITLSGAAEQWENVEFNAGRAGIRRLEARLNPLPGEENLKNNSQTRVLAVDGTKHRILYVEGEPRWEYKFLRRAVEDDPAIEIVSMLRTTQNKVYRQGIFSPSELEDGFPTKPEDLFAYQGLMLGSVESGFFTPAQQQAISAFVDRRGGGLLFLGGRASLADGDYGAKPFSDLLPVVLPGRKGTFHRQLGVAELTDAGKKSLVTRIEDSSDENINHWNILPYLADYQDAGTLKPGAVELARVLVGQNRFPLLVTENYGRGRTGVFATGGSWRWRMQQPVADTSQQTFWRQLIRWTAGETPSTVVASASTLHLDDSGDIEIQANIRNKSYNPIGDATVRAEITTPSGGSRQLELHPDATAPGFYKGQFDAGEPGSYIAEVRANQGVLDLGHDLVAFQRENGVAENFHQQQNRELLQKLAEDTGGRYYTASDSGTLPEDISFSEAGISAPETMDLWNMPVIFLVLLMLRSAEWLLRRRWGAV